MTDLAGLYDEFGETPYNRVLYQPLAQNLNITQTLLPFSSYDIIRCWIESNLSAAQNQLEQFLQFASRTNDRRSLAILEGLKAMLSLSEGKLEQAREITEQSVSTAWQSGDRWAWGVLLEV